MNSAPAGVRPAGPALTLKEFFDGVRAGQLVVQRCAACGELAVPPRVLCSACHGREWERVSLRGEGEVVSFTVIRVPPGRFAGQAPYAIAVVRLPEGVSLLGRVSGIAPDALRVGLSVRFVPPADPAADPAIISFVPRA
ncbi:MAG: Zn-ribbon domain-containing OB-fold protein [Candidatus Rokubacteria bacterium]|nr:Zn-ribbon domain-containing OB-fold protein [Candidatus Rokubacteria bacterium]